MRKYLFVIMLTILSQASFSQAFFSCSKGLIISRLMKLGFDTLDKSEKQIIDSSSVLIALFDKNKCSRVEYHLKLDTDSIYYCDSIYVTSSCIDCFELTLNTFLSNKDKKWKKNSENDYFSLYNKGKSILYSTPKVVTHLIYKLEIDKTTGNNPKFIIHNVWVTNSELKRIKKLKAYH